MINLNEDQNPNDPTAQQPTVGTDPAATTTVGTDQTAQAQQPAPETQAPVAENPQMGASQTGSEPTIIPGSASETDTGSTSQAPVEPQAPGNTGGENNPPQSTPMQ